MLWFLARTGASPLATIAAGSGSTLVYPEPKPAKSEPARRSSPLQPFLRDGKPVPDEPTETVIAPSPIHAADAATAKLTAAAKAKAAAIAMEIEAQDINIRLLLLLESP